MLTKNKQKLKFFVLLESTEKEYRFAGEIPVCADALGR
jgi:hypothetical protein